MRLTVDLNHLYEALYEQGFGRETINRIISTVLECLSYEEDEE